MLIIFVVDDAIIILSSHDVMYSHTLSFLFFLVFSVIFIVSDDSEDWIDTMMLAGVVSFKWGVISTIVFHELDDSLTFFCLWDALYYLSLLVLWSRFLGRKYFVSKVLVLVYLFLIFLDCCFLMLETHSFFVSYCRTQNSYRTLPKHQNVSPTNTKVAGGGGEQCKYLQVVGGGDE